MSFNWSKFEEKISKNYNFLLNEISSLRIDGANQALLDNILVEAYGSKLKINELAQIGIQGSNLVIISPYDMGVIGDIEKAISASNLNLNPVINGKDIKINIPALTQERRQQLTKLLHEKIEESKIQLRNLRGHFKKEIENEEGVSEDIIKNELKDLDEKIKKANLKFDEVLKQKEASLLSL
jgi:ribosome recycling factor